MAVEVLDLNAITKIVEMHQTADDPRNGLPTIEMIKIIQQLVAAVQDHETRIEALEP